MYGILVTENCHPGNLNTFLTVNSPLNGYLYRLLNFIFFILFATQ